MTTPLLPGILNRLFPTGPLGGLLSPEQQSGLQRQGLLQLGMGLLANSGQRVVGTPGAGIGERIAAAYQGVNWPQLVQGAAQQQVGVTQFQQQQGAQQAIQNIAGRYRPKPNETAEQRFERISALTSELAGVPGSEELVGRLSNVLAQLKPESATAGTPQHRVIQTPEGPRLAYFNESTRTWEATEAEPVDQAGGVPQLRTIQGPDGRPYYEEWNPRTGKWTPTGKQSFSAPSEQERRAAFFLPFMPEAEAAIENFTGAPDRFSSLWQSKGFRELTSAERQELDNAATVYAEAWLRLTTGAAYNEQEFQNAYKLFAPQPGDKPATLRAKARRRAELRATLQGTAGRAAPPSGGATPPGDGARPPLNFR